MNTIKMVTKFSALAVFLGGCSFFAGEPLINVGNGEQSVQRSSAQPAGDKTYDTEGGKRKHLSTLVAGIWVDPHGCDHWIVDDGQEGYLSPRLTPDGRPVCSGVAEPTTAVGPFRNGSN